MSQVISPREDKTDGVTHLDAEGARYQRVRKSAVQKSFYHAMLNDVK